MSDRSWRDFFESRTFYEYEIFSQKLPLRFAVTRNYRFYPPPSASEIEFQETRRHRRRRRRGGFYCCCCCKTCLLLAVALALISLIGGLSYYFRTKEHLQAANVTSPEFKLTDTTLSNSFNTTKSIVTTTGGDFTSTNNSDPAQSTPPQTATISGNTDVTKGNTDDKGTTVLSPANTEDFSVSQLYQTGSPGYPTGTLTDNKTLHTTLAANVSSSVFNRTDTTLSNSFTTSKSIGTTTGGDFTSTNNSDPVTTSPLQTGNISGNSEMTKGHNGDKSTTPFTPVNTEDVSVSQIYKTSSPGYTTGRLTDNKTLPTTLADPQSGNVTSPVFNRTDTTLSNSFTTTKSIGTTTGGDFTTTNNSDPATTSPTQSETISGNSEVTKAQTGDKRTTPFSPANTEDFSVSQLYETSSPGYPTGKLTGNKTLSSTLADPQWANVTSPVLNRTDATLSNSFTATKSIDTSTGGDFTTTNNSDPVTTSHPQTRNTSGNSTTTKGNTGDKKTTPFSPATTEDVSVSQVYKTSSPGYPIGTLTDNKTLSSTLADPQSSNVTSPVLNRTDTTLSNSFAITKSIVTKTGGDFTTTNNSDPVTTSPPQTRTISGNSESTKGQTGDKRTTPFSPATTDVPVSQIYKTSSSGYPTGTLTDNKTLPTTLADPQSGNVTSPVFNPTDTTLSNSFTATKSIVITTGGDFTTTNNSDPVTTSPPQTRTTSGNSTTTKGNTGDKRTTPFSPATTEDVSVSQLYKTSLPGYATGTLTDNNTLSSTLDEESTSEAEREETTTLQPWMTISSTIITNTEEFSTPESSSTLSDGFTETGSGMTED